MKKSIIIIGAIVILIILVIVIFDITHFTGGECTRKGGRILNTLGGEIVNETVNGITHSVMLPATCDENEKNAGSVWGLKCPCICCVPK